MELKSCLKAARISLLFLLTREVSRRQDIFIFIFSTSRFQAQCLAPSCHSVFHLIHWDFKYLEAATRYIHSLKCPVLKANFPQFLWNSSFYMVLTASPTRWSFGLSTIFQVQSDQVREGIPSSLFHSLHSFIPSLTHSTNNAFDSCS